MRATLQRETDSNGHPELHITLAGACDEAALRAFSRQVDSELESGPVRRVVVDTTKLEFDLRDPEQVNRAVNAVYVAHRVSDRFQIVDAADRKSRLLELVMTAK